MSTGAPEGRKPRAAFVHLGEKPPLYLQLNIESLKRIDPSMEVFLVGDSDISRGLAATTEVTFFHYGGSAAKKGLQLPRLSHDLRFWDGYWMKTFERLFALHDLQSVYPDKPLLHFESDVRLYRQFPFQSFAEVTKLSWCNVSDTHDVAAIFFSPNLVALEHLLQFLVAEAGRDSNLTDMTGLRRYSQSFPDRVRYLPTVPTDLETTGFGERGLFDGLPTGYWLSGRDPRNNFGFTKRRLIYPGSNGRFLKSATFSSTADDDLQMSLDGDTFPVFNLHVHSKSALFFNGTQRSKFQNFLYNFNLGKRDIEFSVSAAMLFWRTHLSLYLQEAMRLRSWQRFVVRLWQAAIKKASR